MPKYYYIKNKKRKVKFFLRIFSILISLSGISIIIYIFFPLLSWQLYFAPVFAASDFTSPIPKTTIVSSSTIESLIDNARINIGVDFSDAANWFPNYKNNIKNNPQGVEFYSLSIPKLGIKDAVVSTKDNELGRHLVNFTGTAIPPNNGTSVIYGHSTLPQLFNPKDYKTIFATIYQLKIGDEFYIRADTISYKYKIYNIIVVDSEDTSIFIQNYNNSHVTLVTCTPPGTTWRRLIIKAELEKI